MSPLEARLAEDRQLRDAALEGFITDLHFIRQDLRARSVGKRITDRLPVRTFTVLIELTMLAAGATFAIRG